MLYYYHHYNYYYIFFDHKSIMKGELLRVHCELSSKLICYIICLLAS